MLSDLQAAEKVAEEDGPSEEKVAKAIDEANGETTVVGFDEAKNVYGAEESAGVKGVQQSDAILSVRSVFSAADVKGLKKEVKEEYDDDDDDKPLVAPLQRREIKVHGIVLSFHDRYFVHRRRDNAPT